MRGGAFLNGKEGRDDFRTLPLVKGPPPDQENPKES